MRNIEILLTPGFQMMALAAVSVFELANLGRDEPAYALHFTSETGGAVRSSAGATIETRSLEAARHDTTMVFGALPIAPSTPGLIAYLRGASAASRRIAAVCTGAFALAEAGLLDGRRATTHWAFTGELRRLHPAVRVDQDRIFVGDGPVWTSAGMSAGIDLALALVEDDLGPQASRIIAKTLVVYHRRSGGQSQHSALLDLYPKSDRIQTALHYAKAHLRDDLSVETLAKAARLSPRQFSRVFREETGQSPAKAVEHLRLEMARSMMEDGRHPIDVVAAETGFADRERMRRAFLRAFGQPPQAVRRHARPLRPAETLGYHTQV